MTSPTLAAVLRYIRHFGNPKACDAQSDGQLLQRFVAHRDEGAFVTLLQRHGPLVLGVCRQVLHEPHDAEDAFQATFLVLARKAASIHQRESLAAWLYRVAINISRTAKAGTAQQRAQERQAIAMARASRISQASGVDEAALHDWHSMLHEEVDRLPEKYRVPIVLCYLEGKTHDEAARQLGWPLGTVKGRLARARELLRARLDRRGVTLSSVCFAAILVPEAPAAVPAALAVATLHAARVFSSGTPAAAGLVSPRVVALVEGVTRTLFGGTSTVWTAVVVGMSVLAAGLGLAAHQTPVREEPGAQQRHALGLDQPDGDRPNSGGDKQARTDLYGDSLPAGAIARLGTLRFRHGTGIHAIGLSADGKTITTVGGNGSIILHDAATGAKRHSFAGEDSYVTVALAPDGRTLATVAGGRRVSVRETATGNRICEFQGEKEVHELAFSADGGKLACGGGHLIQIWDAQAGKELGRITPPGIETLRLALAPDGMTLATAGWDRGEKPVLCLWETASGRKLQQWQPIADMEETHALAFSPDGRTLASTAGYADVKDRERLRVWAVPSAELLFDLPGRFHRLRYSPCGKVLAAGGSDAISLREADTGKELRRIPGYGPVNFAADGKTLAQADRYATITLWDVATGRKLRPPLPAHGSWVRSVQFLDNGETLASLGDDALYFWQVRRSRNIGRFEGPDTQRVLSPDGKTLAALFWEQKPVSRQLIGMWDTGTGKKLCDLDPSSANAGVMDLVFAPDGRTLAVAIGNRTIQFWDVGTGKLLRRLAVPMILVQCMAFSPDGKTLALGDGDRGQEVQSGKVPKVRLVDAVTGWELRQPFELPETAAAKGQSSRIINMNPMVAFSADGKVVAGAAMSAGNWGTENVLQVWDVATGQVRCRLERASNRFALSPDGKSLVTTAADPNHGETPRLWEVVTGKLRAQIRGHIGSVPGAAFSPDGRLLATGAVDTTVLIWDALNLNGEPPASAKLSTKELEVRWSELAGEDAVIAYRSIRALAAAPEQSVPFLQQHLRPVLMPDPKRLAKLIAELDANQFAIREQAGGDLEHLGLLARPALLQVLTGQPSLEVRQRVERLLKRLDSFVLSGDELRVWRAIEILELIGSHEARKVLEKLGQGAPGARPTVEARAALQRLDKRTARTPE